MDLSLVSLLTSAGIGSMIGGFTNQLAITMLFRPYRPLRVLGMRLPFTPGIIPRRREALARDIGSLVSTQLLTGREVSARLQDPVLVQHLESMVHGLLTSLYARPFRDIIRETTDENWDHVCHATCIRLEAFLHTLPDNPDFRDALNRVVRSQFPESLITQITAKLNLPFGAAALLQTVLPRLAQEVLYQGLLFYLKNKDTIHALVAALEPVIRETLGNTRPSDYFDDEFVSWLSRKITDKSVAWFSENAESVIRTLDVQQMVTERIMAISDPELHDMIQGTTRKELRSITLLGFVIGAGVGLITPLLLALM